MTRLLVVTLAVVFGLAATATTASAETELKIVSADYEFVHGSQPDRPGACSAVTLVQWKEVEGQVPIRVLWTVKTPRGEQREHDRLVAPPYDDVFTAHKVEYRVPAGHHWIRVSSSGGDGAEPNDCAEASQKQREAHVPGTARVEVRVEDPQCVTAKKQLALMQKVVGRARARLRDAKGRSDKASARRQLRSAIRARDRARARVKRHC